MHPDPNTPPVPLPGDPTPLAIGERVLLTDRKGRRYLITLEPGGQWHSHAGSIEHDDLVDAAVMCS